MLASLWGKIYYDDVAMTVRRGSAFRILRDALDDHFSESDRLRPDAAFKKHRREIEGLARRKYLLGQKETDGSVVIKTLDIAG